MPKPNRAHLALRAHRLGGSLNRGTTYVWTTLADGTVARWMVDLDGRWHGFSCLANVAAFLDRAEGAR